VARTALCAGVLLCLCLSSGPARAGATGALIYNWAVATYDGGIAVSDAAVVTVVQAAGVDISPSSAQMVGDPGTELAFPVHVSNTGNGPDAFALALASKQGWSAEVVLDDNADGIHQTSETIVISDTGTLDPGAALACFVLVHIPPAAQGSDSIALTATSVFNPTVADAAAYVAAVTGTLLLDPDFSGSPITGVPPLEVSFTNRTLSPEPVVSWLWDFGDGMTSAAYEPVHTYDSPGTYTVSLTAVTATQSATRTRTAYVTAYDGFRDVPPDHWAYDSIMACYRAHIVAGYADGYYRPEVTVSRAQMAVFISRAVAGGEQNVPPGAADPKFPDVEPDHWAYDYIEYAALNLIVEGYADGLYHPTWVITRAQMAVFIARSIVTPRGDEGLNSYVPPEVPSFSDVATSYWSFKHIEYLAGKDVVKGYPDGMYRPTVTVTRDQMAVFIARAFMLTF